MTLTRLSGSKWWIETDDVTLEIIGTYNKAAINADIQAIRDTLAAYPNPVQDAKDVTSTLNAIARMAWEQGKKDRISALINTMYQSYQGDTRQLEAAQLQARLEALITLRDRLV